MIDAAGAVARYTYDKLGRRTEGAGRPHRPQHHPQLHYDRQAMW